MYAKPRPSGPAPGTLRSDRTLCTGWELERDAGQGGTVQAGKSDSRKRKRRQISPAVARGVARVRALTGVRVCVFHVLMLGVIH